jgi:hypothetical protein
VPVSFRKAESIWKARFVSKEGQGRRAEHAPREAPCHWSLNQWRTQWQAR